MKKENKVPEVNRGNLGSIMLQGVMVCLAIFVVALTGAMFGMRLEDKTREERIQTSKMVWNNQLVGITVHFSGCLPEHTRVEWMTKDGGDRVELMWHAGAATNKMKRYLVEEGLLYIKLAGEQEELRYRLPTSTKWPNDWLEIKLVKGADQKVELKIIGHGTIDQQTKDSEGKG